MKVARKREFHKCITPPHNWIDITSEREVPSGTIVVSEEKCSNCELERCIVSESKQLGTQE